MELKRHLDKPDAVYSCQLVCRGEGYVVLQYVSDRSQRVGDEEIASGTITYALYKAGSGYVTWRMVEPDGRLKGHLFHICKDIQIGEQQVAYLDLMLDLWIDSSGKWQILDREELEVFAKRGVVSQEDMGWIAAGEAEISAGFSEIAAELEALVAGI
jgi:protein associated with RNAse G/E